MSDDKRTDVTSEIVENLTKSLTPIIKERLEEGTRSRPQINGKFIRFEDVRCQYCGTKARANEKRCESCGAPL